MLTLPITLPDWGVAGNYSYYSSSRGALLPSTDSSTLNGSKKRPRVEKKGASILSGIALLERLHATTYSFLVYMPPPIPRCSSWMAFLS